MSEMGGRRAVKRHPSADSSGRGSSSSVDDEEERRARKRLKHNEDENKRRRKLNQQFKELAELVDCSKPHKAAVLTAAISRIQELTDQLDSLSGLGQRNPGDSSSSGGGGSSLVKQERSALQASTKNLAMNLAKNEFEVSLDHNLNFSNGCVAMIVRWVP